MDILLANPVFLDQDEAERELMTPYFPLGLLYLASYLRAHGYSVTIFDGTFSRGEADFQEALQKLHPRVVGLTALQPTRERVLSLARQAHEFGATVIVGGPDPTHHPAKYLAEAAVEFVVHHEGEETLVELLNHLSTHGEGWPGLREVPGLAFRGLDGEVIITPPREYFENLDDLPLPARDLIDMDGYLELWREKNGYASLTIALGRGCPYGCKWCQDSVHGPDFRIRSPESVVAEMKLLKASYKIDRLRVVDDVDGISREWLEEWAKAARRQGVEMPFEALNDLNRKDIPMLDVRDAL